MKHIRNFLSLSCFAAAVLLHAGTWAQSTSQSDADAAAYSVAPLLQRYPADSIQSAKTANQALKDVQDARARVETRYTVEQRACYPKFFTTACLDKVTEKRRKDLAAIRPIEVEANAYLRKAKVVERDRKLAEKAEQNEEDAAQHAQEGKEHALAVQDKAAADQQEVAGKEAQRQKRAAEAAKRKAQYEADERKREQQAAQDAQKRAENIARYNKKVKEAKARQEEVAKKKAQREHDREVKATKAAKAAAAASGQAATVAP